MLEMLPFSVIRLDDADVPVKVKNSLKNVILRPTSHQCTGKGVNSPDLEFNSPFKPLNFPFHSIELLVDFNSDSTSTDYVLMDICTFDPLPLLLL